MLPIIKKILYATGLGAGSPYVFRYALTMARAHHAEISILHVQEPLSAFAQSLVELHITHKHSEEMHTAARKTAKEKIEQRLASLCEAEQCQGADGRDLVTEICDILAHGLIVEREYGVPAVVGANGATQWIVDGQMITVDGDRCLVASID